MNTTAMHRIKDNATVITVIAAAFVAGLVSGSAWTRGAEARDATPMVAQADAEPPGVGERARRGQRGGPGDGHVGWGRLREALDLTDDQVRRIEAVRESHHAELAAHREACREAAAPLREAMHAEVRALLTAEQRTRFDEIRERLEEREHRGMNRGPHGPRDGAREGRGGRGAGDGMREGRGGRGSGEGAREGRGGRGSGDGTREGRGGPGNGEGQRNR